MTTNGTPSAAPPNNHHHPPPSTFKPTGTTLDPNTWAPAPLFLLPDPDLNARIARRNANHHAYRSIGNNVIWHKYIDLGYYIFDDCMDFHKAWKSTAKEAISNRYKTIWKSFHIHRMHDIPINENLRNSALKTAKPYLMSKEPDFLLATDIEFEEKEYFANTDLGTTTNVTKEAESEWTEVCRPKRHRKKSPTTSPRTSPITTPTTTNPIQDHPAQDNDLSDEDLLGIALARKTPLPDDILDPTDSDSPSNNAPAPAMLTQPPLIHNPYKTNNNRTTASDSRHRTPASNTTTPPIHDKLNLSRPPTNTPDNSNPTNSQTQNSHTAFIDLLDEASTQSTNATGETLRQQGTSTTRSVYSQFQRPNEHIPINDGTLRITVRWKPQNYDEVVQDEDLWNRQAVDMLQAIFKHPLSPISFVPWQEKVTTTSMMTKVSSLNTNLLSNLRSPKVSNLDGYSMSIFGVRICATDPAFSTGTWLKDSTVQTSLVHHRVELNISNSTCDSGKMVVAGVILLKHPKYTHRLYFLLALRRQLPNNTPFFDIGTHQRTQNGIESPHLVVEMWRASSGGSNRNSVRSTGRQTNNRDLHRHQSITIHDAGGN